MSDATVYTLTLFGDGEATVRVFATEAGRLLALQTEAVERREAAKSIGEQVPPISKVLADPATYINESTGFDVDVSLDTLTVEG